jgi:hypothetical protein
VLAAAAIHRAARLVRKPRLALTLAATAAAATPNLIRDVWLLHRLLQTDTRALAGRWIKENLEHDSRLLWAGYGSIAPHLTMPWLEVSPTHDRQHAAARAARGLATTVDDAIIEWKHQHATKTFWIVGLSFGADQDAESSLKSYPFLDHGFDIAPLKTIDRLSRGRGLLTRESPRWDLMRRHIAETLESTPESLRGRGRGATIVVLTGMPCDPTIVERLAVEFDEVKRFAPGVPWSEFGRSVMYDSGDAWWLPNIGIGRVERPGPDIRIFKRRSAPD